MTAKLTDLEFEGGCLTLARGQHELEIDLPFRPQFSWLKVTPREEHHCGGSDTNTVAWHLHHHHRRLVIAADIQTDTANVVWAVVGIQCGE